MDVREFEPRTVMWAVAEVLWEEAGGTPNRIPGTMEDTSLSGACVRVKRPFEVGSRVVIKWHREQFSAIAKNCRSDGKYFLLGLRREAGKDCMQAGLSPAPDPPPAMPVSAEPPAVAAPVDAGKAKATAPAKPEIRPRRTSDLPPTPPNARADNVASAKKSIREQASALAHIAVPRRSAVAAARAPDSRSSIQKQGSSSRHERKVMSPKSVFPKFWRRQQDEHAPKHATPKEAPVNSSLSQAPAAEAFSGPGRDLLSYDDIYHAAGIMSPRSGYGIHKVVEMLNSQRIRELAPDIKRASVLMALDAAGTSVDDILQDATRRQHALNTYETAQRKQLEEFEEQKSRENTQIEGEMERIRAHYAQRIQNNRDQVAREKESLRNWQMAMQHESQRISEVIELCGKQPAASPASQLTQTPAAEKTSSAHA